jgi:hypothetical protein
MSTFNVVEFLQQLIGDGLTITSDGEKLKVDTTYGQLDDVQRANIREHKTEILEYLTRKTTPSNDKLVKQVLHDVRTKEFSPKAARATIHMMLYRCQRIMDQCPMETRMKCLEEVNPTMQMMWIAYQEQNRENLAASLELLEQKVIEYVQNAGNDQSTVGIG